MDNKNPNNKNQNNLSPEELFKLMDAEKSDHSLNDLDDFEREALEGLKMVKNREKVFEINSKIDALLEEEDKKKAVVIPLKNNRTLYYFAAAASVALIVGLFFLFNPTNKETQLAVNDTSILDQTTSNDKTVVTELSPEKPNSDAAVVEEKAQLGKEEPKKETTGKGNNNGPVTTGTNFAWAKQDEVSKESDLRENDLDQLKKSDLKTEDKNRDGSVNTAPVMADEVSVPEAKALAQSVTTTNGSANTTYRYDNDVKKKEQAQKGIAETEKQNQVYYKNSEGEKDKANDSTLAYNTVSKNGTLNFNQAPYSTSTNSNIPAAGNGTTAHIQTSTVEPNTTVLAKAEREEVNTKSKSKGFGEKKKARSKSMTPSYASGETKPNDKKTSVNGDADANKNEIVAVDDLKNKKEEKTVNDSEEKIYTTVEQMPEYLGGSAEMMKYIMKNISAPKGYTTASSKITINFIVNADGVVSNARILKGFEDCEACRTDIIKAFNAMPKWKPGKQNGKLVKVKMSAPIILELK